jgi:hypothetical protein
MPARKDPLDRLAERESLLRDRRDELTTGSGVMRLALRFYAALAIGWAVVLAAHWIFFASPRWLVLTHTVAYVLVMGYWTAAALMLHVMRRRMPEIYGGS